MKKNKNFTLSSGLLRKPIFWLALAVLLGGFFRFYNLDWDFEHSFHPDERNILGQTAGIQSSNGFRVQFFAYGQLPVYLYRATGELLSTPEFLAQAFGGHVDLAQGIYWLGLLLFFGAALWFFSKEKLKLPLFGAAALAFVLLVFLRFFPVFTLWFSVLEDWSSKLAGLVFVSLASFGLSAILAEILEVEWVGMPFYIASGITFLLGVVPLLLPDAFSHTFATLSFTLLVVAAGCWLAWITRWGRVLLAVLSVWAFWAGLPHGGHQYLDYGTLMVIGRWWAALFSTATIPALYLLVRRFYQKPWTALFAAAAFAFSVVSIQVAHYCITESFITLMLVVVAFFAHDIVRLGNWKSYLLAGAAFGISMSAKTSSLYYILIIVLAHLLFLSRKTGKEWLNEDRRNRENRDLYSALAGVLLAGNLLVFLGVGYKLRGVIQDLFNSTPQWVNPLWIPLFAVLAAAGLILSAWGASQFAVVRGQGAQWIKLIGAGLLSFFLFCLLSPWSLLDLQGFLNSMDYEWHVVSIADACYVLQFKDSPRYLFHLQNLMSVELWWPLGIAAVAGAAWVIGKFALSLVRVQSKNYLLPLPFLPGRGLSFSLPDLLLLVWFIPYFGFIGAWNTKFIRYMVPLIPFFCVFAALFLADVYEWVKSRNLFPKALRALGAALVLGGSLFYSAAYMHVYSHPHPWIDSSVWIFKNVPPGSTIYNEAWGDGLPVDVDPSQDHRLDHLMSTGLYHSKDLTPYELHGYPTDDSPIKRDYYANALQSGDYISISSKKLWYTLTDATPEFRPHGFNVYPITSRYYRLLWSGLLGFKMVGEFHNFPSLFGWEHPDDMAEESFSVYDHPRVYLFKRFETVPKERILKLLDSDDYVKGVNRDIMRNITPANVDAFIASRQQYLQDHGLLAQLDQAAPVTQMTPVPSAIPTPAPQAVAARPAVQAPKAVHKKPSARFTPSPSPTVAIEVPPGIPALPPSGTLRVLKSLADHPVTETDLASFAQKQQPDETFAYQFRAWLTWALLLLLLGALAFPLSLRLMESIPAAAWPLGKILGTFLFAWLVWFSVSLKIFHFTPMTCWVWIFLMAAGCAAGLFISRKKILAAWKEWHKAWLIQEAFFLGAFALFTIVRIYNPHIHDPGGEGYNGGGEAGMDYGFLASVVRGETFPPENMWMAGQPIGYTFYFGHLLMGVLTKTLGLVPAVTYNLAIITLFALIFSGAFALAYALSRNLVSGAIAGVLCAAAGNLDGAKQYLRVIHDCLSRNDWTLRGLWDTTFDYWGPTRVIPHSINEFPYFSVLFADMHAHTLAMPFAMLVIGLIMSFYLSDPAGKKNAFHWPLVLAVGFLVGGIAFLNTWEVPTWCVLFLLALLLKNLAPLPGKALIEGFKILIAVFGGVLILLGIWANLRHPSDPLVLGGTTPSLVVFALAASVAALSILYFQKSTKSLAQNMVACGLFLAAVLATARVLWAPFFSGFAPQQSEVLWVMPPLRTVWGDYFTLYGLFLSVMVFGFLAVYSKPIQNWIGSGKFKFSWDLESLLEALESRFSRFLQPESAVQGMVSLGVVLGLFILGASWAHWTDPQDRGLWARLLAGLVFAAVVLAVYIKKTPVFWAAAAVLALSWIGLMALGVFHLTQDAPLFLGLGLFFVLWLAGFFNLGLAVQTQKDRALSFTFLLIALFFLVTSTLEVFVMKEYLGGDYMRNNSLFKFGINAWTLASVAAGVLAPKLWALAAGLLKSTSKETKFSRMVLTAFSFVVVSWLLHALFDEILFSQTSTFIYVLNLVFVLGILAWIFLEEWLEPWVVYAAGAVLAPVLIVPLLPSGDYTSVLFLAQRFFGNWNAGFLFPAVLALFILIAGNFAFEKKKNKGVRIAALSWKSLVLVLSLMALIYPLAGTFRKCHGFFGFLRARWGGVETPTLNGLSYLKTENTADAAAIRFLNETVPGQPCLVEAVGLGYNTWGSRYSIFTGIPALMGWDGHVREWVGERQDADISLRYANTETIFNTHDVDLAKRLLDADGVRLVIIGPLERGEADTRKRYDADGLAKFPAFLPLIYKNPSVEIYYNPPPGAS